MNDRELLDELLRVATRLGVEVRIEPFETPPARGGGRCRVGERQFILLDARAPLGERVGALASALASLDLDDVYLAPEARDRVEEAREPRIMARESVPLAPLSTMGVGGPARWYLEARDEATVARGGRLGRAAAASAPRAWRRLEPGRGRHGGGWARPAVALRGISTRESGQEVELTAAAGEPWDAVVRLAVDKGWAGLECLSGIPGLVGATPIQNVGAYGQEVSDTVVAVRALDRTTRTIVSLAPAGLRVRIPGQRVQEPHPGPLRRPRRDLPAASRRRARRALRGAGAAPGRAGHRGPDTGGRARERARGPSGEVDGPRSGGPEPEELRVVLRQPRRSGRGGGSASRPWPGTRPCRAGPSRTASA